MLEAGRQEPAAAFAAEALLAADNTVAVHNRDEHTDCRLAAVAHRLAVAVAAAAAAENRLDEVKNGVVVVHAVPVVAADRSVPRQLLANCSASGRLVATQMEDAGYCLDCLDCTEVDSTWQNVCDRMKWCHHQTAYNVQTLLALPAAGFTFHTLRC